ncbi:MAG: DnaJ domain-containing protein [Euryarchaeota archaeon]|nr:DnaJ domain-containing protein [Euryarchaeota archaeon]
MPIELLNELPTWLLLGVGLGTVASAAVGAVFYFGDRLFPPIDRSGQQGYVDGNLRRHAEIRSYLSAIDERFVENADLDGFAAAFYLPDRDVAITFDPRVFFGLESAPTYVVLCEDEMPVATLGRRLPFEVEEPEREAGRSRRTADRAVTSAFQELGLDAGASQDEVRSAYRSLAKEAHPDRGGTEAEFKQLQDAYTTAKEYAD